MPEKFAGFPAETVKFLKDLARNNDRDWFQENKPRYEAAFLNPSLEFIEAMQPQLAKAAPHLTAIPKKMGGSLMRIYKDTRFSKDKTPYKTNIGIQFRHEAGKNVHAPGCYFHIEPGSVFLGVGIWHPEKEPLKLIREQIVADPTAWKRAAHGKKFQETFKLAGDSLKRNPLGFDPEHPLIEDIKRKDFIAVCDLDPKVIHEPALCKEVVAKLKVGTPLMRFLCEALQLPY